MPNTARHFNLLDLVYIQFQGSGFQIPAWIQSYEVTVSDHIPDLIFHPVHQIQAEAICFAGTENGGYTGDSLVFFDKQGVPAMSIDMQQQTAALTVACKQGTLIGGIFEQLLHLAAIQNDVLPLHAASCQFDGKTALISSFPQGGKTSTLLSFLAQGGYFISDDWAYLTATQQVRGLPLPMTLRAWQLDQLPAIRGKIKRPKQMMKQTMYALHTLSDNLHSGKVSRKLADFFENRSNLAIQPHHLFEGLSGDVPPHIDVIYLPITHTSDQVRVEAIDQAAGIALLHQIQMAEWADFLRVLNAYHAFRPSDVSRVWHTIKDKLRQMIESYVADTPIYLVYHPRPVALQTVFEHLAPYHQSIG